MHQRLPTMTLLLLGSLLGQRCPGCGVAAGRPGPCMACASELERLSHNSSPPGSADFQAMVPDRGIAAQLVRAGKHGTWRRAGPWLAAWLIEQPAGRTFLHSGFDCVTWVPADAVRRRRRGGHLPETFARSLARHLGVPAIALIERRRGSVAQRGTSRDARRSNAARSFQVVPRHRGRPAPLGWRVLLVDDVATTGATLAAVATLLRGLGAAPMSLAITAVELRGSPSRGREKLGLTVSVPGADDFRSTHRKDNVQAMRRTAALDAGAPARQGPATARPP